MLYSAAESEILGLRIGRYNHSDIDTELIIKAMADEKLDICRLKFSAQTTHINEKLIELNLPFYYGGSILNYEMHFFDLQIGPYLNKNIEFHETKIEHKAILKNLIIESFVRDPIGYYKIPNFEKFASKKDEAVCMAEWHINLIDSPDHLMMMSKMDGTYNGFIAIYKSGDNAVITPAAGVLPGNNGKNVFHDLRTLRHAYCLENKIPIGYAGARLGNFYSQRLFIGDGMMPTEADVVYFVTKEDF